jgi:hypothetical protein
VAAHDLVERGVRATVSGTPLAISVVDEQSMMFQVSQATPARPATVTVPVTDEVLQ